MSFLPPALDRARNTGFHGAIERGAAVYRSLGGSLAIDVVASGAGPGMIDLPMWRLSDPCDPDAALALADDALAAGAPAPHAVRGPVLAADAVAARLRGLVRVLEGHEMIWRGPAAAREIAGALATAAELAHPFDDWRAAFVREAFAAGGSPPHVAPDQLFIWVADGAPRAMAGRLPLGTGTDSARVVTVYTPPADRGRGYAGALVAALAADSRARGVTWLSLDVAVDNAPGLRAYERAGFRTVGHTATWMQIEN